MVMGWWRWAKGFLQALSRSLSATRIPVSSGAWSLTVYDWASAQARWSGDVKRDRTGPVALQAGDVDGLLMNLAIVRDVLAGKPLRYRLVDEGRVKPMNFVVEGVEDVAVGGQTRQATKVVNTSGNRQTLVWVVEGLPLPVRILQRKDGKDEIDLRMISVR